MLKTIKIPLTLATTNKGDPYKEGIIPLFKNSLKYDRGVAYFYSEWVDLAKEGLVEFIEKGGKIRLLTSAQLNEAEFEAFKRGEQAKFNETLKKQLVSNVSDNLTIDKRWTLSYLSWMISEGILDVKISIHKTNEFNIYHDKISIFSDNENKVCLHGSLNDSRNAMSNQESINVFQSWYERDNIRIERHQNTFNEAWNNNVDSYYVIDLPEMLKVEYEKLSNNYNPYKKPINKPKKVKRFKPREYQKEAIIQLENNNWNGIFSMATGTGKTLTSLFAIKKYLKENKATICIVVPQLHLLQQWVDVVKENFNNVYVLKCAISKNIWGSKLFRLSRKKDNDKQIFVFTTYKTLTDPTFKNGLKKLRNVYYIFDECHKLGSSDIIKNLDLNKSSKRLGLSATPDRWLDEKGNDFITNNIGETVYEFSLERAIKEDFLTEYNYYINFTTLNIDEFFEYERYTTRISKLVAMKGKKGFKEESLKIALNNRANIVKEASNKFDDFFKLFDTIENKKNTIVYVYNQQVKLMIKEIRSRYNLNVQGIIAETKPLDRTLILEAFNNGEIDVLVAIKCLDEGIDIPNCDTAFILASSTNPREFIQRRGRVLRKAPNKEFAIIYDFVTIAPEDRMLSHSITESLIKRELPRVAEFIRASKNTDDLKLRSYLMKYGLLHLYTDLNPWNIEEIDILREEEENE